MNSRLLQIKLLAARLDPQHVRFFLVILSLTLFVLGAGAPEGGDSFGK